MKITRSQLTKIIQEELAAEDAEAKYDMALDDLGDALRNAFSVAKEAGVMDMDIKDAIADALDYVRTMT